MPLPDDPFTRGKCSFKVLEYSASGLPVVALPVGTNAEYVLDGVQGIWPGRKRPARAAGPSGGRSRAACANGGAGRGRAAEFDVEVVGVRFAALLRRCLQAGPSDRVEL